LLLGTKTKAKPFLSVGNQNSDGRFNRIVGAAWLLGQMSCCPRY